MKRLALLLVPCLMAVGCTGSDPGDVQQAQKAAATVPKSTEQLPSEMPPAAKSAAAAAMGQAQQMQSQASDPARVRAMEEMKKQHP